MIISTVSWYQKLRVNSLFDFLLAYPLNNAIVIIHLHPWIKFIRFSLLLREVQVHPTIPSCEETLHLRNYWLSLLVEYLPSRQSHAKWRFAGQQLSLHTYLYLPGLCFLLLQWLAAKMVSRSLRQFFPWSSDIPCANCYNHFLPSAVCKIRHQQLFPKWTF